MKLHPACLAMGIGVVTVSQHHGVSRLHRAVPGLSARLVVSLDGPIEVHYDTKVWHARSIVAGFMRPGIVTAATALRSQRPIAYVELSPSAWQRLTGVPLREVDAGGVSADAVLPRVNSLSEELADRPVDQREAVLRARLLDQLRRTDHDGASEDAFRTLDLIKATRGAASVEDLAQSSHLSPRRLRQVMQRSLGISPKFASRVARLGSALTGASAGAGSWAEVAAEYGYHDQSHLVHDFRDLMGTSPSAWLDEEGRNLQGWQRPAP